jgi:hypothetical protein
LGLLIATLLAVGAGEAPPAAAKASVLGAAIQVRLDSQEIALGDLVRLRVSATAPPEVEIGEPEFVEKLAGAELVGVDHFGPDVLGDFVSRAWELQIDPAAAGRLTLPPIRVRVHRAGEPPEEGILAVVPIEIASKPGLTGRAAELREIPAAPGEGGSYGPRLLRWGGVAVLFATLAYAAIQLFPRRPQADPARKALSRLEEVEREAASASGSRRAHAQRACDVLREYLEVRYALPATRQTTIEFLRDARTQEGVSEGARRRLEEILSTADVERFGLEGPSDEEWRSLAGMIREFLHSESTP